MSTKPVLPDPSDAGPSVPSLDTNAKDSIGNPKQQADMRVVSGVAAAIPADAKTAEQRKADQVAADKALAATMQSTQMLDSVGKPKGEFKVKQMGYDKHGARIPDQVDYNSPIDTPPAQSHGARGKNMPKDSFSG